MPNVMGREFPYTPQGMAAAQQYRQALGMRDGGPMGFRPVGMSIGGMLRKMLVAPNSPLRQAKFPQRDQEAQGPDNRVAQTDSSALDSFRREFGREPRDISELQDYIISSAGGPVSMMRDGGPMGFRGEGGDYDEGERILNQLKGEYSGPVTQNDIQWRGLGGQNYTPQFIEFAKSKGYEVAMGDRWDAPQYLRPTSVLEPIPDRLPLAPPTPIAPTPIAPTPIAPTPIAPTPIAPTPIAPTPIAPRGNFPDTTQPSVGGSPPASFSSTQPTADIPTIFGSGGAGAIGGGALPAINSLKDLATRGRTDLNSALYGGGGGSGSVPLMRDGGMMGFRPVGMQEGGVPGADVAPDAMAIFQGLVDVARSGSTDDVRRYIDDNRRDLNDIVEMLPPGQAAFVQNTLDSFALTPSQPMQVPPPVPQMQTPPPIPQEQVPPTPVPQMQVPPQGMSDFPGYQPGNQRGTGDFYPLELEQEEQTPIPGPMNRGGFMSLRRR